jgi:CRISPR-associated protein Csm2
MTNNHENIHDFHKIITDPDGAETLVASADAIGQELCRGLTTSQIRALFGEVRQIQGIWDVSSEERRKAALRRLILLKPKMAYRARKESKAVGRLVGYLKPALDEVIKETDPVKQTNNFKRFVEYFEAILAYHQAYGGK